MLMYCLFFSNRYSVTVVSEHVSFYQTSKRKSFKTEVYFLLYVCFSATTNEMFVFKCAKVSPYIPFTSCYCWNMDIEFVSKINYFLKKILFWAIFESLLFNFQAVFSNLPLILSLLYVLFMHSMGFK